MLVRDGCCSLFPSWCVLQWTPAMQPACCSVLATGAAAAAEDAWCLPACLPACVCVSPLMPESGPRVPGVTAQRMWGRKRSHLASWRYEARSAMLGGMCVRLSKTGIDRQMEEQKSTPVNTPNSPKSGTIWTALAAEDTCLKALGTAVWLSKQTSENKRSNQRPGAFLRTSLWLIGKHYCIMGFNI